MSMVTLKVPALGESVSEATLGTWKRAEGDSVQTDEPLVEVESEKATVELPAPAAGVLKKIRRQAGDTVSVGEVIAEIDPAAEAGAPAKADGGGIAPAVAAPAAAAPRAIPPSARRLIAEHDIALEDVQGTGRGGRIQTRDVQRAVAQQERRHQDAPAAPVAPTADARERVVPMSPLRRTVAHRLLAAQRDAAILTTFNEIDMSAVTALRERYQDRFQERYGIKLGFMSFFVKAVIEGLKAFPIVNGEVRGSDVVYKDHYDIGVAVGGGKGLVVPVVRDADQLSFAGVEQAIAALAKKAKDGKLTMEEMEGGTFTISNGGVYGSLLSTPILNPPQSGILGLHAIVRRPVGTGDGDAIALRPMMYVALSYDHRIIDGREAVQFLVRVKECVEQPERILIEV